MIFQSLFKKAIPASFLEKNLPQHIAIIMDGNGRWAKRRGLPRAAGHKQGVEALRRAVKACVEFGVKYLSVYAFSTENWGRPREEVDFLMMLLGETINREVEELNKNGVRIRFLGRLQQLPVLLQQKMAEAEKSTENNQRLKLNIMLSYGGRAEIVDAAKKIIQEGISSDQVTEETISRHLYTCDLPDPDLLIRTAEEKRVSNFMLWQTAYSELYFTSVLWPDFDREEMLKAILDYQKRVRRFGRI